MVCECGVDACRMSVKIAVGGERGEGLFMTVDEDKADFFRGHSWTFEGGGYLQSKIDGENVLAHRMVFMGTRYWDHLGEVHHRNGDKTDNRRANLMPIRKGSIAGRKLQNTIRPVKGVDWYKQTKRWRAQYRNLDGKNIHIGFFECRFDAVREYHAKLAPLIKIMEEQIEMEWEDFNI
jgi:hypothetical protein